MSGPAATTAILILMPLALFAVLLAGVHADRRAPARVTLAIWIVLPLALLPWFVEVARQFHWTWFLWAKTYSVVAACAWIAVLRTRRPPVGRAMVLPLYVFLLINIAEAVALDMSRGHPANALVGGALIVTASRRLHVDGGPPHDVRFDLGASWVIAYSVWNWVFVAANYGPVLAIQHVAVLAAPLFFAGRDGWDLWLQARSITLGLYLLLYDATFAASRALTNAVVWPVWNSPSFVVALQAVSALVMGAHLWRRARRARAERGATAVPRVGSLSSRVEPAE